MTRTSADFSFLEELTALSSARLGDMEAMAAKLRRGTELTVEERNFLADYLLGVVTVDLRAKRRLKTIEEHLALASFVLAIEALNGGPREAAIADVENATGAKRRKIQMALATHRREPGTARREAVADALRRRSNLSAKN